MVIHREAPVLIGATRELLPISAHPSRGLDDDPEQYRPQQEQTRGQHEVQPVRVRMDAGGDRRPRDVQLERPDVLVAESTGTYTSRSCPNWRSDTFSALLRSLTSAVNSPSRPSCRSSLDRERLADQLVLVGVEHLARRGTRV